MLSETLEIQNNEPRLVPGFQATIIRIGIALVFGDGFIVTGTNHLF